MSPVGFKARMGNLIHTWWRHTCYIFPEITSGVTLADLLAASMAAKPSHVPMIRHWWGSKLGSIMAATHSVGPGKHSTE